MQEFDIDKVTPWGHILFVGDTQLNAKYLKLGNTLWAISFLTQAVCFNTAEHEDCSTGLASFGFLFVNWWICQLRFVLQGGKDFTICMSFPYEVRQWSNGISAHECLHVLSQKVKPYGRICLTKRFFAF